MKLFISWSGARSRKAAEFLRDWLPGVIQAVHPWISTRDLDRGAVWFRDIYEQLKETSHGIVCLTHENKNRPWVLFEAGALAKGLEKSRVCTFLVDLQPKDVEDPLAQFNHTSPSREGMLGLLRTLNGALAEHALEPHVFERAFNTYWPHFENGFATCLQGTDYPVEVKPRPSEELLAEILENTRSMSSRLLSLEQEHGRPVDDIDSAIQLHQRALMASEARLLLKRGMSRDEIAARIRRSLGPGGADWVMSRLHQDQPEESARQHRVGLSPEDIASDR